MELREFIKEIKLLVTNADFKKAFKFIHEKLGELELTIISRETLEKEARLFENRHQTLNRQIRKNTIPYSEMMSVKSKLTEDLLNWLEVLEHASEIDEQDILKGKVSYLKREQEQLEFDKTILSKQIDDCNNFLANYPGSPYENYVLEHKAELIEKKLWVQSKGQGIAGLRRYLKETNLEKFREDALKLLKDEELRRFQDAIASTNIKDLQSFLFDFPDGLMASQVKEKISLLEEEREKAEEERTRDEEQKKLELREKADQAAIQKNIEKEDRDWHYAKQDGSLKSLSNFQQIYPNGRHRKTATQAIEKALRNMKMKASIQIAGLFLGGYILRWLPFYYYERVEGFSIFFLFIIRLIFIPVTDYSITSILIEKRILRPHSTERRNNVLPILVYFAIIFFWLSSAYQACISSLPMGWKNYFFYHILIFYGLELFIVTRFLHPKK